MRAAAILRPGSVSRAIVHFQRLTGVEWISLLEKPDVAVLFGGDGTIHWHLAELVDLGVPLLSMHATFEMSSKVDVWNFYRLMMAFYQS